MRKQGKIGEMKETKKERRNMSTFIVLVLELSAQCI
jgi:hypothetical protein